MTFNKDRIVIKNL